MSSQDLKFEIGFWHPFGPHAGETAEQIIQRKQKEIDKNHWTLWSFQFRNTLKDWYKEIKKINPGNVLVFCSNGNGAKDPTGETKYCNYYIPISETTPKEIPIGIKIPHPMGKKIKGSAFIVKNILYSAGHNNKMIEWLKDEQWQTTPLPTRPEYLIKVGQGQPMPKFRVLLQLQEPYLAEVGVLASKDIR